jgi:putative transposase
MLQRPLESAQYAAGAYVQLLRQHQMLPSMSRPANPYDNASCESFMKTLKREEIYANAYRDLEHIHRNMAAFIDQYYNRIRLHSALGYRPRRSSSTRWHQGTCLGRPGAFVVGHSCPRK